MEGFKPYFRHGDILFLLIHSNAYLFPAGSSFLQRAIKMKRLGAPAITSLRGNNGEPKIFLSYIRTCGPGGQSAGIRADF
jgi:hypothetical protein